MSVAAQTDDPTSLLSHYRDLIRLRNAHSALRNGDWVNLRASNRDVYAFLRRNADETLLVLINFTDETVDDLTLRGSAGALPSVTQAEVIFGDAVAQPPAVAADGSFEEYAPVGSLEPYETVVIRLT